MRLVQLIAPKNLLSRLALLLAALSPRLISLAGSYVHQPESTATLASSSKISSSKVMLKHHAEKFAKLTGIDGDARGQLPNLLLLGYLLRLLEERLIGDIDPPYDA